MKITIDDLCCSYSIDWDRENRIVDDFLERYYPPVDEVIEGFCHLLENIYSREKIADCLAAGIDALDYSEKGVEAKKRLQGR